MNADQRNALAREIVLTAYSIKVDDLKDGKYARYFENRINEVERIIAAHDTPPQGDFGEPWRIVQVEGMPEYYCVVDRDNSTIIGPLNRSNPMGERYFLYERIIVCVNTLAGRSPNVSKLIRIAKDLDLMGALMEPSREGMPAEVVVPADVFMEFKKALKEVPDGE